MTTVRTRFAPSPTGWLHVGGTRTALFAWLVARQAHGQFLLRLEDTDRAREVEGADQHIMDILRWLGLNWDEGPDADGPYGPYRQSERLTIYKEWAEKLVGTGRAYADPYSTEQMEVFRSEAKAAKKPFLYRDHRPEHPPLWDGSQPLRFKSDPKVYRWDDAILGKLSTGPEVIDDFILMKSDGYPTYNFAHIIDDHLMEITHVIRSQEFTASVPKFLNLYEALDFSRPIFATVPYVLGPDGKKKLSKRDGAKDLLDYARDGYLADAMFNFLATLGWNDGTTQEIFSRDEIIAKFELSRVSRGGASFDEQRLLWLNGHYVRQLSGAALAQAAEGYWPAESQSYDATYKAAVLGLVQERLKFFAELPKLTSFFFAEPSIDLSLISGNPKLSQLEGNQLHTMLETSIENLKDSDFSLDDLTRRLNALLATTNQKPAVLFSLLRIATTWAPASPPLAATFAVLGKTVVLQRLSAALEKI
jgi:glutamyl-tRNA synthetase